MKKMSLRYPSLCFKTLGLGWVRIGFIDAVYGFFCSRGGRLQAALQGAQMGSRP